MPVDEKKVLKNAKLMGKKWLKAFKLDGKADKEKILSELSKRTFKGKPVEAVVVDSPEEAVKVLKDTIPSATLKKLEPWNCIWDYYSMAFYNCAYSQCPDQSDEFGRQSFFEAFKAGLGFVINLGGFMVGVCLPEAHKTKANKLHRKDGPAIVWGDHKEWWLNDIKVTQKIVEEPETITIKEIIKEQDEKVQNIMMKLFVKHHKDNLDNELFPYSMSHTDLVQRLKELRK